MSHELRGLKYTYFLVTCSDISSWLAVVIGPNGRHPLNGKLILDYWLMLCAAVLHFPCHRKLIQFDSIQYISFTQLLLVQCRIQYNWIAMCHVLETRSFVKCKTWFFSKTPNVLERAIQMVYCMDLLKSKEKCVFFKSVLVTSFHNVSTIRWLIKCVHTIYISVIEKCKKSITCYVGQSIFKSKAFNVSSGQIFHTNLWIKNSIRFYLISVQFKVSFSKKGREHVWMARVKQDSNYIPIKLIWMDKLKLTWLLYVYCVYIQPKCVLSKCRCYYGVQGKSRIRFIVWFSYWKWDAYIYNIDFNANVGHCVFMYADKLIIYWRCLR